MKALIAQLEETAPWLAEHYFEVPLWAWIGLPTLFFSSFIIAGIIVPMVLGTVERMTKKTKGSKLFSRYILSLRGPIILLLTGVLFDVSNNFLPFEKDTQGVISKFEIFTYTLSITWILLKYSTYFSDKIKEKFIRKGNYAAAATIPLFRKVIKAVVAILATLFLLQNFGFDIAAIIAALGVGGIAVALASQKSVENLFGGMVLALDQPIRVGEFGKFGDILGTVEDIGLRSSRIRMLNDNVVTIPNATFADMSIENITARGKILFKHVVGLRYETTSDQIRYIVMELRKLLLAHPMIEEDPARARFISFNNFSQDIEVFAYVKTADWNEYTEVQEDLLLRIRDIVLEGGSDFAFPSSTIYFERGSGLSSELQEAIAKKVKDAQQQHQLMWPDLPDNAKQEIIDSITYPLEGAAVKEKDKDTPVSYKGE